MGVGKALLILTAHAGRPKSCICRPSSGCAVTASRDIVHASKSTKVFNSGFAIKFEFSHGSQWICSSTVASIGEQRMAQLYRKCSRLSSPSSHILEHKILDLTADRSKRTLEPQYMTCSDLRRGEAVLMSSPSQSHTPTAAEQRCQVQSILPIIPSEGQGGRGVHGIKVN